MNEYGHHHTADPMGCDAGTRREFWAVKWSKRLSVQSDVGELSHRS